MRTVSPTSKTSLWPSLKCLASVLTAVLLAACAPKNSDAQPDRLHVSVFDSLLTKPAVSDRVKKVEQDLPGDNYRSIGEGGPRPMRWNDSRRKREQKLAAELLENFQLSLKKMSVSDLVAAMKIYPTPVEGPDGVAYWLCGEGNQMIINELRIRPAEQLEPLKSYVKSPKFVFLNESYSADLGLLCREILESKGVKVPEP